MTATNTCDSTLDETCNSIANKLLKNIKFTVDCRYQAAQRLSSQGHVSFLTTIALSLGLVFIPLLQTAGIALHYPASVLSPP